MEDVGDICLYCWIINYGLNRNAEVGKSDEEDQYPEDKGNHGPMIHLMLKVKSRHGENVFTIL